jgi:hypothetical protein
MLANLTTEDIKTLLFQLPISELIKLIAEVEEKLDTTIMMQLAETSFDEWNEPEEDIAKPFDS